MVEVVAGLEHLADGWSLTWATGPSGNRTGPTALAASGAATLRLDLDQVDRRPRRIARRHGSQSCLPQHTLGSQSAESPNRHGGETT